MSADLENTLILTLDTGPVTIKLRPDLAPGHVARIKEYWLAAPPVVEI